MTLKAKEITASVIAAVTLCSTIAFAPQNNSYLCNSKSYAVSPPITDYTIKIVTGSQVRVRSTPAISNSNIIGEAADFTPAYIFSTTGNWAYGQIYCVNGNVVEGYISLTYLTDGTRYTTTARSGLNVRSNPSTSSAIVGCLPYGSKVVAFKTVNYKGSGTWCKVKRGSTVLGWVSADYLEYYRW